VCDVLLLTIQGLCQEGRDGVIRQQLLEVIKSLNEKRPKDDARAIKHAVKLPSICAPPALTKLHAEHYAPLCSSPFSLEVCCESLQITDKAVVCNCDEFRDAPEACIITKHGVCAKTLQSEYTMAMVKGEKGGGYEDIDRDNVSCDIIS